MFSRTSSSAWLEHGAEARIHTNSPKVDVGFSLQHVEDAASSTVDHQQASK